MVKIKITIGSESILLSESDAYQFAELIETQASISTFEAHVDNALKGWGGDNWTDGGTC